VLADGVNRRLHKIKQMMREGPLWMRPHQRSPPSHKGERVSGAVLLDILDRKFKVPNPDQKGWPIKPTAGQLRAGSMWRSLSTCFLAALAADTVNATVVTQLVSAASSRYGQPVRR
jgi:hypothetical protein